MLSEIVGRSPIRWIPLLPLLAATLHGVCVGLLRRSLPRPVVAWVSCSALGASLALSLYTLAELVASSASTPRLIDTVAVWIGLGVGAGALASDIGFVFDPLSALMCCLVSGVGLLVHVYALGWMQSDARDDRGFQRFFMYMGVCTSAMLVLVLAGDLLFLFLGWQAVALGSLLSTGFWFSDPGYARAGTRGFVAGRVGDVGFVVATLLLFWSLSETGAPSLALADLGGGLPTLANRAFAAPDWLAASGLGLPGVIALGFLLAALARSLSLSGAVAAPLPASALMQAVCTLASGAYLVCRLSPFFAASPAAQAVLAWTGATMALFAAVAAALQNDVRKLLAWSTLSQFGLILFSVGAGYVAAALYQLFVHGLAKALLFMGAGIVVLALDHESDLRRLGGFGARLGSTRLCMAIGVFALAGLPPTAGFFSLHQILAAGFAADGLPGHQALCAMLLASVFLTAFYAARLLFVCGGTREPASERSLQIQPPGRLLLVPTGAIATLCLLGLLLGMPQLWGDLLGVAESNSLQQFLAPVLPAPLPARLGAGVEWWLTGLCSLLGLLGIAAAHALRGLWPGWADALAGRLRRPLASGMRFAPRTRRWRSEQACADPQARALGLRGSRAGLVRPLLQSGLVPVQLVVSLAGGLALLAWLLFGGPA